VGGYAWLNPVELVIPKLEVRITLRLGEAHIYKGFTHPSYRGRRLGLDRYAHWFGLPDPPRVMLSDYAFDNHATMARVQPLGMERFASGWLLERRGRRMRHLSPRLADRKVVDVSPTLSHRDH
ncbi:MAG: hypothetical protein AAGA56_16730, partial [Myxococcota bacterium]